MDSNLILWGQGSYGRLGKGNSLDYSIPVNAIFDSLEEEIIDVHCGAGHVLALGASGKSYSWGKCYMGSLGHNEDDVDKSWITVIETLKDKNIVKVVAGTNHSTFLSKDGVIYTCGNGFSGALGHGDGRHRFIPTAINQDSFSGDRVISVAAGEFHTLFLTEKYNVYVTGQNNYGQLGNRDNTKKIAYKPIRVQSFCNENDYIKEIYSGRFSCFALSNYGDIYAWGRNNTGQLGIGSTVDSNNPVQVKLKEKIKKISSKGEHTYFLTETGEVFGAGIDALLGLDISVSNFQLVPVKMKQFEVKVLDISAGHYHSVALLENNDVQSWGETVRGCLGNGENEKFSATTTRPTMEGFQIKPVKALLKENTKIVKVAAGSSFSAIISQP